MKKIILIAFAGLLMTACATVHEFPEGEGIDPTLIDVTLDLEIDMNYAGEITRQTYDTYVAMLESDYDIRYTVEIYKAKGKATENLTERIAKFVHTSDEVVFEGKVHITENLRIPAADYMVLAWVDFVNKSGKSDLYYKTDNLTDVSILKPDGTYRGYNNTKDAFSGKVELNLAQFRFDRMVEYSVICPVSRPLAVYKIITTDVDKYLYNNTSPYSSIRPATTYMQYRFDFPVGYNTYFAIPNKYELEVTYNFDIEGSEDESEALIASDYVLVYPEDIAYVDFDIRDAEGKLINTVEELQIPLKRNMITIIRDEFLTTTNSGGITIDDKFKGEIIIEL